jgi:DNA replication and repair protein RecF
VRFERVRHYRFRNLSDAVVDTAADTVFLIGENGHGKSNFLESLYLMSYGASFRTRRDTELVAIGADAMAVDGTLAGDGELSRTIAIRYENAKKEIRIDGETVQDRRDMIAIAPSVVFRHDDMGFVNGAPEMQRWFVDQTLSMQHPLYVDDMRRYKRALRNRNALLREQRTDMLDAYDRELAEIGISIQEYRRTVVREFGRVFTDEYRAISAIEEEIEIRYRPSWDRFSSPDQIVEHLGKKRIHDLERRTTTSGPHRDRIVFRYRDRDFLELASTGQIRLASLILRVAQARFFYMQSSRKPILLLDDVLLELDPGRRKRFVERLPPSAQRVFTFLPGEPYELYADDDTLIYSVRDGRIGRDASG